MLDQSRGPIWAHTDARDWAETGSLGEGRQRLIEAQRQSVARVGTPTAALAQGESQAQAQQGSSSRTLVRRQSESGQPVSALTLSPLSGSESSASRSHQVASHRPSAEKE